MFEYSSKASKIRREKVGWLSFPAISLQQYRNLILATLSLLIQALKLALLVQHACTHRSYKGTKPLAVVEYKHLTTERSNYSC